METTLVGKDRWALCLLFPAQHRLDAFYPTHFRMALSKSTVAMGRHEGGLWIGILMPSQESCLLEFCNGSIDIHETGSSSSTFKARWPLD